MKKNFKNTPAAAHFITDPKPTAAAQPAPMPAVIPESTMQIVYRKIRTSPDEETRAHKRMLLIRPSLYETAFNFAQKHKVSFNSLVDLALTEYIENHE